jgi:hypothetical protein
VKERFPLRRTDHEAILASGQPTCTGCRRSYRRQESEAVEKKETLKRRMPESDEIGAVYRKLRLCLGLFEHDSKNDEAEEDDEEKRYRLRWCRRGFRRIVEVATRALLLGIALLVTPGKYFISISLSIYFTDDSTWMFLKIYNIYARFILFYARRIRFANFCWSILKITYNKNAELDFLLN